MANPSTCKSYLFSLCDFSSEFYGLAEKLFPAKTTKTAKKYYSPKAIWFEKRGS